MDGAVYDWSLKDLQRNGENILKSCNYSCAVAMPDGKTIFACGSDKLVKEICDSQIVREIECSQVITQIALSHSGKMLFVGTVNGRIRSMKFPFGSDAGLFQEHQAHSSAITKLHVSFDDQYLFSVSEDGCLYIFRLTDKEGRNAKQQREREVVYADEILVTRSDLQEKSNMTSELKMRVEELKMENEYQLRLKDMSFNEKIKDVTEKFTQEIEALKITKSVLKTDKDKEEVRHQDKMTLEKEKHAKMLLELEMSQNAKLLAEYDKFQELQEETNALQLQWDSQLKNIDSAKDIALQELTSFFEQNLQERQMEIDHLQEEMRTQLREYDETTKETEEDADNEIVELKNKYERKLKDERESGLRLKGENGIMRKKFNTLQSEIDAHRNEIQKMVAEEKKLHNIVLALEKDIAGLKREVFYPSPPSTSHP